MSVKHFFCFIFSLCKQSTCIEYLDTKLGVITNAVFDGFLIKQLSLASIHYLRSHYQEAIDIYKRILLDNRYQ